MNRKKILIVMPELETGGAQRSLISLLNTMDYSAYDVTVGLFRKKGLFLKFVPDMVNVIEIENRCGAKDGKDFILYYLKHFKFINVAKLVLFAIFNRQTNSSGRFNRIYWNAIKNLYDDIPEKYDTAIGYIDTLPVWYVSEKVTADKKVSFNRNDYTAAGYSKQYDKPHFSQMAQMATVSEDCKVILDKVFPEYSSKITVVKNITNDKLIRKMADLGDKLDDAFTGIKLLTIARTSYQKGIDLAIDAMELCLKKTSNIRWYVIGRDTGNMAEVVRKKGLEANFFILPETDNPYGFMKSCDIYVQPSRWEGRCNTIMEAKILGKPIIACNYPTVKNQLKDKFDGIIADMDADSISNAVELLVSNEDLREKIAKNAENDKLGNTEDIKHFYALM